MNKPIGFSMLLIAMSAIGCQESQPPLQAKTGNASAQEFDPKVDAGWKGVKVGDATLVADLKKKTSGFYGQSFAQRNDPFALMPEERAYEASQGSERVVSESDWRFDYEAPAPKDDSIVVEPQPYRRLAGVIVGESVLALIDMGDGRSLEIIRPGQRIPNSEWTVVSIDEDKAILKRSGNKLPRQIIVRLESPPAGLGGGQPAGGGGFPGSPQGPTGPPGGGRDDK